jgi:hypothetical protein
VATLRAATIMRIDVEVKRLAYGRVSVPQACYDKLAYWYNETHQTKDQVLGLAVRINTGFR